MGVGFTVELNMPRFGDTARVELVERDGVWVLSVEGVMGSESWAWEPRTFAELFDAYSALWSEVEGMGELGYAITSETWVGV